MKTSGVSCETKFGLLGFLGHPNDQEEDQTADKGKYSKLSNTSTWPLTRLRKDYLEFSRPFGSTVGLRPISKAICPLRQRQVEVCRRKTQLIDLQTKTGTNVKSNEIQKEKLLISLQTNRGT